jgi:hypothetical protein
MLWVCCDRLRSIAKLTSKASKNFKESFETAHYADSLIHMLHCLPVSPVPVHLGMVGSNVPPSHRSVGSTNTWTTGQSSEGPPHSLDSFSSLELALSPSPDWLPDWASPTTPHLPSTKAPERDADGHPWAMYEV